MTQLLILSFSDIRSDARVIKQVREFARDHAVTTCGFGDAPIPGVTHVSLDQDLATPRGIRPYLNAVLLRMRMYRLLYWSDPLVRAARRALAGRRFDAVLANDLDTVPLAVTIADPTTVHADLHEYFPGLHDDSAAWVRLRKPYLERLILRYVTQARSVTTVGEGVAESYLSGYGIRADVVTNATPKAPLEARAVGSPIALVHSGVAQTGRQLELTIDAVRRTRNDVRLDLYLMPSDELYLTRLRSLAAETDGRVRICDPVAHSELVHTLNRYDVGVFLLPPTTTNNAHALPNKFFDFVQARLGIVVGPSPEMARLTEHHGLGIVTDDFSADSLVAALDALDPATITEWKAAAEHAADDLSAETQVARWRTAIATITGGDTK